MKVIRKDDFDAIYEENVERVYRTALRYSENHYVAEEVTQSVFLKFYINMDNVKEESVGAWLLTTAKHMALNYNRKVKREILQEEIDHTEDVEVHCRGSCEEEVLEKFEQEERRDLLKSVLSELYHVNPQWYDAVTITCCLEKPVKEVAESMGINPDGVYSMLYRARKWIRKKYGEQFKRK